MNLLWKQQLECVFPIGSQECQKKVVEHFITRAQNKELPTQNSVSSENIF